MPRPHAFGTQDRVAPTSTPAGAAPAMEPPDYLFADATVMPYRTFLSLVCALIDATHQHLQSGQHPPLYMLGALRALGATLAGMFSKRYALPIDVERVTDALFLEQPQTGIARRRRVSCWMHELARKQKRLP